jgi:hypothetical protein
MRRYDSFGFHRYQPSFTWTSLSMETSLDLSPSVAGHALTPATRRSLGRPLPHQLTDRPRGHPRPINLSHSCDAVGMVYPVLAAVSHCYPRVRGRFLTCYSPVRRFPPPEGGLSLDLHVLGAPPAFVLSQDQTLRRDLKLNSTNANKLWPYLLTVVTGRRGPEHAITEFISI